MVYWNPKNVASKIVIRNSFHNLRPMLQYKKLALTINKIKWATNHGN